MNVKLGDIFYAILTPTVGSEQDGIRPVLVVQNNRGNRYSPTTIVVPITSNLSKKKLPTHVLLSKTHGLEKESMALIEQIRTLDKSRFLEKITKIDKEDLDEVKKAIKCNLHIRGMELF